MRQLGDNVVLILNTVKALTQPEMMNLVNNLTQGFHEAEDQAEELPTSTFGLLKQMRDPDVRRGSGHHHGHAEARIATGRRWMPAAGFEADANGNGHSIGYSRRTDDHARAADNAMDKVR